MKKSAKGETKGHVLDPNTTYDIIVSPTGFVTELSDTVDSMDGTDVEVVEIINEADGTDIELTIIEEPTGQPGVDSVDRFIEIDGIGPNVAAILANAGITKFSQLAETPVDRIREILAASGTFYRIHDATRWQEEARQLAHADTGRDAAPERQNFASPKTSRSSAQPKPTDDQSRSDQRE